VTDTIPHESDNAAQYLPRFLVASYRAVVVVATSPLLKFDVFA